MQRLVVLGLDGTAPTLLEEYAQKGLLPHFQRLMEQGTYRRALSCFPGVTPINWASIATGAYPQTHGIVDFVLHLPGEPLNVGHSGFTSDQLQAETLWESLARQGHRTATVNFPGALPPRTANTLAIVGEGSPGSHSRYELRASSCFATATYRDRMRDADLLDLSDGVIHLVPEWDPEGHGPKLRIAVDETTKTVTVTGIENVEIERTTLIPDRFSSWWRGRFSAGERWRTGTFRVRLSAVDWSSQTPNLSIYVSQVMPVDGLSFPDDIGPELVDAIGPCLENSGARGLERGWVDDAVFLEEGAYKGHWLVSAIQYLLEQRKFTAVWAKWHFLDHVAHGLWGQIDPISPWYQPERAEHFEQVFQQAYQTADAMVGRLMAMLGPDDILIVVSDHGQLPHLKAVSINNLLRQAGLLTAEDVDGETLQVDWTKTQAYAGPCLGHVHLNLKGRDPDGIVEPAQYRAVQASVIKALTGLLDPESGIQPVQLAIPVEDGPYFGQGGPRAGDVLYFMEAGYTGDINWFPLTTDGTVLLNMTRDLVSTADYGEGRFIASKFQSAHGCGFPTRELGRGTEEAILFISAKELAHGDAEWTSRPVLVDVAPTASSLLGLAPPRQSEGRVVIRHRERER